MNWLHYIGIIFILIICAAGYIRIARRYSILDIPNDRSSHKKPIIRGGGILFFIAMIISFIVTDFQFLYAFLGIVILAILSFLDDIISLSATARLPIQVVATALICYQLGVLDFSILLYLVTVFVAVAFINIFNFMDGINSITGCYGFIVLLFLLTISYTENLILDVYFIPLLSALGIFGYFNFRKDALVFAGDVGSISLAAFITFFLGYLIFLFNAPIFLLAVAVYAVDGAFTIFLRALRKENITQGHRNHLYQKLVDTAQWSHLKVSLVYSGIQFALCVLSFVIYTKDFYFQLTSLIILVLLLCILYFSSISRLNKWEKM